MSFVFVACHFPRLLLSFTFHFGSGPLPLPLPLPVSLAYFALLCIAQAYNPYAPYTMPYHTLPLPTIKNPPTYITHIVQLVFIFCFFFYPSTRFRSVCARFVFCLFVLCFALRLLVCWLHLAILLYIWFLFSPFLYCSFSSYFDSYICICIGWGYEAMKLKGISLITMMMWV